MTRTSSPRLLLGLALALSAAACSATGTPSASLTPAGTTPAPSAATAAPSGTSSAPAPPSASASASASASVSASPTPDAPPELPRGGTSIFPDHTVVMYYGTAGTGALGVLGETSPQEAAERLEEAAAPFGKAAGTKVLPAFELITTVASSSAGKDGDYSDMLDGDAVQEYIDAARENDMLVVLDFQPGRAEFLDQVKQYEEYLVQPEVGVALDPEWKLKADQVPLEQIGVSRAAPINEVSQYLSDLVVDNGLPEKIFLVHQFKTYMLPDREKIVDREGLATVLHVDGFGSQEAKFQTYDILASRDGQFVNALKLFYDEDVDLLTPAEAMKIKPRPMLISYQ